RRAARLPARAVREAEHGQQDDHVDQDQRPDFRTESRFHAFLPNLPSAHRQKSPPLAANLKCLVRETLPAISASQSAAPIDLRGAACRCNAARSLAPAPANPRM